MYCPRCGEQQSSGNLRFCNRCGFLLESVSTLIERDGVLQKTNDSSENTHFFSKRNFRYISLGWFAASFLLMFIFLLLGVLPGMPLTAGIVGLFGTLLILSVSSLLKDRNEIKERTEINEINYVKSNKNNSALPPKQQQSANEYVTSVQNLENVYETDEFAQPPSVTEETTKLLEKNKELEE